MRKLTTKQQDKLIEAAQNAVEFTVEGNGRFPLDMLRYDLCWPAEGTQASLIGGPGPLGVEVMGKRRVMLKGLKVPTEARWASFGWKVID